MRRTKFTGVVLAVATLAVWAVCLAVKSNEEPALLPTALIVYDGERKESPANPSGWMPDGQIRLSLDPAAKEEIDNHTNHYCHVEGQWDDAHSWMAVAYFWRDGSFDKKTYVNVKEKLAVKDNDKVFLKFRARSRKASVIQFKVGSMPEDSIRFGEMTDFIQLAPEWTEYKIDLSKADLTKCRTPFIWSTNQEAGEKSHDTKAFEFDLDEIQFVVIRAK
jgi:hypothetical protein